jgi:hypothetical protein
VEFPASERRGIFAMLSCEERPGQMPRENRLNGKLPTHEDGENTRSDMTIARRQSRTGFAVGRIFLK